MPALDAEAPPGATHSTAPVQLPMRQTSGSSLPFHGATFPAEAHKGSFMTIEALTPPSSLFRRIKAFRAPYPGGEEPAFGFGRASRLQARMSLRHTLSSDIKGPHAGLHVLGASLMVVNGEHARLMQCQ